MNVVPDTSAVVDGRVSERVAAGDYADATVVVPETVIDELESQANAGRDSGWEGIEELQRLLDHADDGGIAVEYADAPTTGTADAVVRETAQEWDATLLTSDVVQSEVARAKGIDVEYVAPQTREIETLAIEAFFDDRTMSVHLRAGAPPMAKRGTIGEMRYERIDDAPLDADDCREWAAEIEAAGRSSSDGFVELEGEGMTIVQFRDYRIAVARPPFADAFEVTTVRPIVKTTLDDYALADDLRDRLRDRQRGVLIAGSPGAGKSTLATAVAEFLSDAGYAVKTMEKPRDLQVGDEVTQYTALDGAMANTADSLLMVRPDYTIYDEVRKTDDFEVFADMRLAGVGMVGVVHATRAIDALQRLVGRVELGLIPQVVDTVVYVEAGDVDTVYDVTTEVKVPTGLTEEDLARPVIVIREFESERPVYEIYTFNRQVVTVPVSEGGPGGEAGVQRIARDEIEREIRSIADGHVAVELEGNDRAVVYVDDDDISQVIGKGGGRIADVEDRLGISIDVRSHDERPGGGRSGPGAAANGGAVGGSSAGSGDPGGAGTEGRVVEPEVTGRHVVLPVGDAAGETVEVRADDDYLFTATVSRGGEIQVSRGSAIADELERAIDRGRTITVVGA